MKEKKDLLKRMAAMLEEVGQLLADEESEEMAEEEGHMEKAASAIASFKSEWVWAGVSHNAYIDRGRDILPLALLQKDLDRQTKWITEGRMKDYGGLWVNHSDDDGKPLFMVAGQTLFKAIVPGTRMLLEAGTIKSEAAELLKGQTWPMSIGYWYTANKEGQYTEFVQYERSVLVKKMPANPLTFFKVYPREAVTPDVLAKLSGE